MDKSKTETGLAILRAHGTVAIGRRNSWGTHGNAVTIHPATALALVRRGEARFDLGVNGRVVKFWARGN